MDRDRSQEGRASPITASRSTRSTYRSSASSSFGATSSRAALNLAIEVAREFGELAESESVGLSPQTARERYLRLLGADFNWAAREVRKKRSFEPVARQKTKEASPSFKDSAH